MNVRETRSRLVGALFPAPGDLLAELGMPSAVEERLPLKFAKAMGLVGSFAVFAGLAWSSVAHVNEVAIARGTLQPIGFEQTVQHLEGGIVQEILVREGQLVRRGETLMVLRDAYTLEDDETLARQRLDLAGQLETQKALQEGREPDFGFIPLNRSLELINNRNAYQDASSSLVSRTLEFDSQISQARFTLEATQAQVRGAEEEVIHTEAEQGRFGRLLDKGLASGVQHAEKQRLHRRAKSDLAALRSREAAALARLEEVERQKKSFVASQRATTSQRILEIESALTALEGRIRKKDNRLDRLQLTAPIDGVVKAINVDGSGAVVAAGQALLVLVPVDKPLVAETRVGAGQIGYLQLDMPAHIKISAFDFTRYGWLPGRIESISPSAFEGDNGRSYYIVRIQLEESVLEKAPNARLLPGMDITADIITGDKTFLQYLLTPLQRTLNQSFGER